MKRRDFVQRLPVLTVGLATSAGTASLSGCGGTPWVAPRVELEGLSIDPAVLASRGDAFLQTPAMERPIYVRRLDSGEVVAVLASCTHRGCQPEPVGDRLACPCHGSEFAYTGEVLTGPADRALTRYRVVEAGGRLVIAAPGGDR